MEPNVVPKFDKIYAQFDTCKKLNKVEQTFPGGGDPETY